ncbi:MAG: zf-HC2 domain-containing protein [Bacteroidales bacterium]|nr:zf-HC2 domain-containing protein [Lachnoclostridium sp.]MCM1383719.1 zf-HC2 domain-containing protein [Lachnoclostridium sp.]MCM1464347.1 zf-HC2 domain-containing protein [Bacteroidales bacterium]
MSISGKEEKDENIRLNCDIVRDLVPSYLENICSESSEKAVEAHLSECVDCFKYVQGMRETTIEAGQIHLKEMDHMKKMRRYYDKKVLVHLIGILVAALVALWCMVRYWDVELKVYGSIAPVVILVLLFLLKDGQKYREKGKMHMAAAVLSVLGIVYIIGLSACLVFWLEADAGPFGMALHKTGPFLHYQIVAVVIMETILFVWSLRDAMQKDRRMGITPAAALVGILYGMAVTETLYRMDDVKALSALFWQMFFVFAVEAVILGALAVVMSKPLKKMQAK